MTQRNLTGLIAALALVVGVVGAIYIAPPSPQEPELAYLQQYPEPRALPDFTLTDQHGAEFTTDSLQGQWTLAFLGYTYCPDICPTTLAELNAAYENIQAIDSPYPIEVLFISVDPNRDTVERLAEYIGFFNPAFTAVTGEHADLFPMTRSMGMMYAISGDTQSEDYLVDHSASVVVINPRAQVVGRFRPVMEPGKLAISDTAQILEDLPVLVGAD